MARKSSERLKVRMPVNEMCSPKSMALNARSRPPVKQCSTAGKAPFPVSSVKDPRHVGVAIARMDHQRQPGFACGGDVLAEALFLRSRGPLS